MKGSRDNYVAVRLNLREKAELQALVRELGTTQSKLLRGLLSAAQQPEIRRSLRTNVESWNGKRSR